MNKRIDLQDYILKVEHKTNYWFYSYLLMWYMDRICDDVIMCSVTSFGEYLAVVVDLEEVVLPWLAPYSDLGVGAVHWVFEGVVSASNHLGSVANKLCILEFGETLFHELLGLMAGFVKSAGLLEFRVSSTNLCHYLI